MELSAAALTSPRDAAGISRAWMQSSCKPCLLIGALRRKRKEFPIKCYILKYLYLHEIVNCSETRRTERLIHHLQCLWTHNLQKLGRLRAQPIMIQTIYRVGGGSWKGGGEVSSPLRNIRFYGRKSTKLYWSKRSVISWRSSLQHFLKLDSRSVSACLLLSSAWCVHGLNDFQYCLNYFLVLV